MKLPNFNADTVGQAIEAFFERLETMESLLAELPLVGQYANTAYAATAAADGVTKAVVAGVDAVENANAPAKPAPVPAAPPPAAATLKAALAGIQKAKANGTA